MKTKDDVIAYCNTFPGIFIDQPFHDEDWVLARHGGTRKTFVWIFTREGHIWINVKVDEDARLANRERFESVLPAYHLNKEHWNSVILDGSVPDEEIRSMIGLSFELTS